MAGPLILLEGPVLLYDAAGVAMAVQNGVAIPAGTSGLLAAGSDGTNSRFLLVDASGRLAVVGAAASGAAKAGSPVQMGGVFNTTQPTVTTGQAAELQTSARGSLLVTPGVEGFPVTANAGTNLNTSALALDATLTGGTQKAIARGGAKGATAAADLTGTAEGVDHQALDVQIYHGGTAKDPTSIRALTATDVVTAAQGAANTVANGWPAKITDGTNTAAVKPASTAPTATDPALVVVLGPNQQAIPVTTSPSGATQNISAGTIDLAAITTAAIRRTAYTEQTVSFTGSIVSSSAADAAAGTGARTVNITWMDSTGTTVGVETVTLNGTTPVNLVTATKCFIEKMEVATVGSGGSNAGILTLKTAAAGGGTTVGTIAAADNVTFWAHHYVKSGKTCNVTGVLFGSTVTNNAGIMSGFLRAQVLNVANAVEKQVSDFVTVAGLQNGSFRSYGSQIQVAGPARITAYVTTLTGSAFNYRGSFDSYDV